MWLIISLSSRDFSTSEYLANIFLHVYGYTEQNISVSVNRYINEWFSCKKKCGKCISINLEIQKSRIFRDTTKLSKHQRNRIFAGGNRIRQKSLDKRLSFSLLVLLRKYILGDWKTLIFNSTKRIVFVGIAC